MEKWKFYWRKRKREKVYKIDKKERRIRFMTTAKNMKKKYNTDLFPLL